MQRPTDTRFIILLSKVSKQHLSKIDFYIPFRIHCDVACEAVQLAISGLNTATNTDF
ncbi:hypothetical protein SPHV1_990002 [Novosphingobium sp. KN65.2]|nr:hypothetical protein SPHV1_990002 [Novosphingobium sp. KN65.2]